MLILWDIDFTNKYLKIFYVKYSCNLYCIPRNETSQFCVGWVNSDWKRYFVSLHGDLVGEIVKVMSGRFRDQAPRWRVFEREKEREEERDLEIDPTDVNYRVYVLLHPVRSRTFISRAFKSASFLRSDISQRPSRPNNFGQPILSMPSGRQCQSG